MKSQKSSEKTFPFFHKIKPHFHIFPSLTAVCVLMFTIPPFCDFFWSFQPLSFPVAQSISCTHLYLQAYRICSPQFLPDIWHRVLSESFLHLILQLIFCQMHLTKNLLTRSDTERFRENIIKGAAICAAPYWIDLHLSPKPHAFTYNKYLPAIYTM